MRSHVIDIGPNVVRRLCCGGATVVDIELEQSAFESIDDTVTLVDLRPVTVASLWQNMLETIHCGADEEVTVVYPSWWSTSRVDVVTTAVRDSTEVRPRSWLLAHAAPSDTLIVEIADDFVVVMGATMLVETRRRDQLEVVEAVGRAVLTTAADTVVIDVPAAVRGARTLAAAIAKGLPGTVVVVDDIRFRRLAAELKPGVEPPAARRRWPLASLVLLVALPVGVSALRHHAEPRVVSHFPTTTAVEGHVAVEVPADWPMKRVIAGPGSARLQFTSPADPEVALHVTQSRVGVSGLDATADFLRRAIDEASDGAFVDFNPADHVAGRSVVTYREIRSSHDIRWTVWVDEAIRISVGCQTPRVSETVVGEMCELAIRSARAFN